MLNDMRGLLCSKFGHRMAFGVVPFVSVVFLVLFWFGMVEFGFNDVRSVRRRLAIIYCLVNSGLLISVLLSNWILEIIFVNLPQNNADLAVLLEHLIVFVICNLSAYAFTSD